VLKDLAKASLWNLKHSEPRGHWAAISAFREVTQHLSTWEQSEGTTLFRSFALGV